MCAAVMTKHCNINSFTSRALATGLQIHGTAHGSISCQSTGCRGAPAAHLCSASSATATTQHHQKLETELACDMQYALVSHALSSCCVMNRLRHSLHDLQQTPSWAWSLSVSMTNGTHLV